MKMANDVAPRHRRECGREAGRDGAVLLQEGYLDDSLLHLRLEGADGRGEHSRDEGVLRAVEDDEGSVSIKPVHRDDRSHMRWVLGVKHSINGIRLLEASNRSTGT